MSLHYLGKHEPGNCVFSVRHSHVSSPEECGWLRDAGRPEVVTLKLNICYNWPVLFRATHILQEKTHAWSDTIPLLTWVTLVTRSFYDLRTVTEAKTIHTFKSRLKGVTRQGWVSIWTLFVLVTPKAELPLPLGEHKIYYQSEPDWYQILLSIHQSY